MHLILLVLLLVAPLFAMADSDKTPFKTTFLNPDSKGNEFWDNFSKFMEAAAQDLGIDLTIAYANGADRFEYLKLSKDIMAARNKPDALIAMVKRNASKRMFSACDTYQVDCFTVNTDIPSGEKSAIGKPREKYARWVGQTLPDDKTAGTDLAERLIKASYALAPKNGQIKRHMIALNGSGDSSAALERGEGLFVSVQRHPEVSLKQVLFTGWDPDDAYEKTSKLLERYPDTNIIWGASDSIARAAVKRMNDKGLVHGTHFVAGGIDWSRSGVKAVVDGELSASIGGHFIEGAIALILLFDRYHGLDFQEDMGTRYAVTLETLHKDSPNGLIQQLQTQSWDQIDFKRFSKALTPNLKRYDFSISNMLFAK